MRSGGGSFQHPLTEPLFSRRPSYLPPFLSLCFSSLAFKMAVHLSGQLANWALSMTGPLVNSDLWNPFNRAAFQHPQFHYRNHRLLSGNDPLLSPSDSWVKRIGDRKKKTSSWKTICYPMQTSNASTKLNFPFFFGACKDIMSEFLKALTAVIPKQP